MKEIDEILAVEPKAQTARNWVYWRKVRSNFPAIVERMKKLDKVAALSHELMCGGMRGELLVRNELRHALLELKK